MLDQISLSNFKCFESIALETRRLNVLTGTNGAGKSTVIQALLLLHQSARNGSIPNLRLNGQHVELGSSHDVLYRRSNQDSVAIALSSGRQHLNAVGLVERGEIQQKLLIQDPELSNLSGVLPKQIAYLSADRLSPRTWYPLNAPNRRNFIGKQGEYAPLLLSRYKSRKIRNTHLLLDDEAGRIHRDVKSQFALWMARLFPGFDSQVSVFNQIDAVVVGFTLQQQVGAADFSRPPNIGFGVSIALPVIVAGLLARPSDVLIIESPEAHLHPSAQSTMGEFLASVAAGGTQVFVETHSDHIVNGVRITLRNEVLNAEDTRFFAFSRGSDFGSHRVVEVAVNQSAEFLSSPENFFDQADKDLRMIYGVP